METLTTDTFVKMIGIAIDTVVQNEKYFSELDANIGDGDFGASLAAGFRKIEESLDTLDRDSIGSFLRGCGMIIMGACGGVTGPLWGNAFREAGKYAKDKQALELSGYLEMLEKVTARIEKEGGARQGDKTLLDALIPAVESMRKSAADGRSVKQAFAAASDAAAAGAEATKKIPAKKGRASYLGERTIGFPDAGAVAVSRIFEAIAQKI
jgi:dihydroxyacetone kinase-like protein